MTSIKGEVILLTPLSNWDAEQESVGAALCGQPEADLRTLLATCNAEDFENPDLGELWSTVGNMVDKGTTITLSTLKQKLKDNQAPKRVGDLAAQLFTRGRILGQLEHGRIVKDNANRRRAQAVIAEMDQKIKSGGDLTELIDRLQNLKTTEAQGAALKILNLNHAELEAIRPELGKVENGPALLYPGAIHDIHGISGLGKTWIGLALVLSTVRDGHSALVIDFEDSPATCLGRLIELGATASEIDRIGWLQGQVFDQVEMAELIKTAREVDLILIDTTALALEAEGYDENSNSDYKRYLAQRLIPLARAGAAVLSIDHVSDKAKERGAADGARGASAKKAGITGASYQLTGQGFDRQTKGHLKLRVVKDRHGWVGTVGTIAAEITVTPASDLTGTPITFQLSKPAASIDSEGTFRPSGIMSRIYDWVADQGEGFEFQAKDLRDKDDDGQPIIPGKAETRNTARDRLVSEGYLLKRTDQKGSITYWINPDMEPFSE